MENGSILIQGVSYAVTNTSIELPGGNEVVFTVAVDGDQTAIPVGTNFRLYDDDGLGEEPLPRLNLVNQQMQKYFEPAFVSLVDASSFSPRTTVPFRRNQDVSVNLYGFYDIVVANSRDCEDKNACWVAPLTAAYQGPEDHDRDPATTLNENADNETIRDGESATYGGNDHSTVFLECNRDGFDGLLRSTISSVVTNAKRSLNKWTVAAASHEIAHQPGIQSEELDHAELGLMSAGLDGVSTTASEKATFQPKSIVRFRSANRWSK